jgi:hypothetical protein
MRRARVLVAILGLVVVSGCGYVPTARPGDEASPTRTASSTLTSSPSPNPMAFQAGDCVSTPASGATRTQPFGDYYGTTIQAPPGWTREAPGPSESELAVFDAPAIYTDPPTKLRVLNPMGYYPNSAVNQVIGRFIGPDDGTPIVLVGEVGDCSVQSDSAAFLQYTQGDRRGYIIAILHFDSLYEVQLEGSGGVDQNAVRDAKQLLGSWQWTVASPRPH